MPRFPTTLPELFFSAWRHRRLIHQFARREVEGRYRGSYLGLLWPFASPLAMLAVYTLFFGVIMQSRWGANIVSTTDFAINLFAGLIVFNLFAEIVSRAPGLILSNVNYVKRVVFPLEILPWTVLLGALFHLSVSLGILLAAHLATGGGLHPTLLLLPLVLAPFALFLLGLGWFLAATGTYIRDIGQLVGMIQTALLFLSPVFYPVSTLGPDMRFLVNLSPLTFVIEAFRSVTLRGATPDWHALTAYWVLGIAAAWLGFVWFQKTRKGFADVV